MSTASAADSDFKWDVFLSHSSKDKDTVRDIANRLKSDGVKVWFDEWEIRPGDSIPAKIEDGLEHSRVLVLCLSAAALGSDWAQLESHTFRFKDPLNHNRRFIPLRLDDARITGALAIFSYIDWSTDQRNEEYSKLLLSCYPDSNESGMDSRPIVADGEFPEDSQERVTFAISIEAECNEETLAIVRSSVIPRIHELANDSTIRVRRIGPGSVIIVLEAMLAGYEMLKRRDEEGDISKSLGFQVLGIAFLGWSDTATIASVNYATSRFLASKQKWPFQRERRFTRFSGCADGESSEISLWRMLTDAANVVEVLGATVGGNRATVENLSISTQNLSDMCAMIASDLRIRFKKLSPSMDELVSAHIESNLQELDRIAENLATAVPSRPLTVRERIQLGAETRLTGLRLQQIADEFRRLAGEFRPQ